MAEKPKKIYDWSLECVQKHHKFSIETEEENSNKIDITKMSCPSCQSAVQFSAGNFGGSATKTEKSLQNRRRENSEMSKMAMQAAAEHAVANPPPKMKELHYAPGKGLNSAGGFNRPEKVPVDVIESLEKKFEGLE